MFLPEYFPLAARGSAASILAFREALRPDGAHLEQQKVLPT
jgi:hypothetical protein